MSAKAQRLFVIGTAALLLLNLLQAAFTEPLDDETYYWMYSQYLDWGYFDHPPMVALMIRAGYTLFHNTIGLRLFSVLATFGSAFIMLRLIEDRQPLRLLCIILSVAFIQLGGFLAVPDAALVFFSSVFLLCFHRFLLANSLTNAILLGACMAVLLYSKYQGLLLIVLCLIANLNLLRNKYFWLSVLTGVILFLPHLYWQYRHGFPPLRYFLADQYAGKTYHFYTTTDYIAGQLFFFGPLIGWMVFLAAFSKKTASNTWTRTLKFIVIGVTGFFFLVSFKGVVEPNWTAVAIVPAILLLHAYLETAPKLERLLYGLTPFSILLMMMVRIAFIWDLVGDRVGLNKEIHDSEKWTGFVKTRAGNYPVLFVDSYQRASKYVFYQKESAGSYNGRDYRNNQYDIWHFDKAWEQDSVLVVTLWKMKENSDSLDCSQGRLYTCMFANPNIGQSDLYQKLPPRKALVPFFKKRK
jgi:hypothetical protein